MTAIVGMAGSERNIGAWWDAQRPSDEARFRKLDTDGNGVISKAEFSSAAEFLSALTGRAMPAGKVDAAFAKLDADGNGGADLAEFESAAARLDGGATGAAALPDRARAAWQYRSVEARAFIRYRAGEGCGAPTAAAESPAASAPNRPSDAPESAAGSAAPAEASLPAALRGMESMARTLVNFLSRCAGDSSGAGAPSLFSSSAVSMVVTAYEAQFSWKG